MAKEIAPAFQFYPKDFLADQHVLSMTLAELGAYIKLLCVCWLEKSLPDSELELAKLCHIPPTKFRKLWPAVSKCFSSKNGALIQQRMEREREKQAVHRDIRAKAGSKGGKATALLKQTFKQTASKSLSKDSSPSSSPVRTSVLKNSTDVTAPKKSEPDPQVKEFLEWFPIEYAKRRNDARYFVVWPKHSAIVKRLLKLHALARLKDHAIILLTTDEEWTEGTDRGIEVLAAKINWFEDRLAAWEKRHGSRQARS